MERVYILILKHVFKKRFFSGQHERILRNFDIFWSNNEPSAVYRNIYRLLSLYKVNDDDWAHSYHYLRDTKQLKNLGEHDELYLWHYIDRFIGRSEIYSENINGLNIELVSQTTKDLFPFHLNISATPTDI